LRDHALHVRSFRSRHKVARSLDAQTGIAREAFLVLRRARCKGEIRQLMDDGLWHRCADRARERFRVEDIDDNRLGTELAQGISLVRRPRRADDGVADRAQQRRELAPDRPARSCQKYFHAALNMKSQIRIRPRSGTVA
jgi:hypothetical protein